MYTNISIVVVVVVDQMADIVALTNGHDEIGRTIHNFRRDHLLVVMYVSSQVTLHDHSALHGFTNLAI